MDTISGWLLPSQLPELLRAIVLLMVLAVFTAWILLFVVKSDEKHRNELKCPMLRLSPFLAFIICYCGFLVASISIYDAATPLDPRILSPLYAVVLVVSLCIFNVVLTYQWSKRLRRFTAVIVFTILMGSYAARAAIWSYNNRAEGIGWTGKAWANSEIINRIRELPPGTKLFTNRTTAVYWLTERPALLIPQKMSDANLRLNQLYSEELVWMRAIMEKEGGRLVYIRMFDRRRGMPSEEELKIQLGLRAAVTVEDGVIYQAGRD